MRTPRIFFPQKLDVGTQIVLDAAGSKHILRVLRLKTGAELTIFNGSGNEFLSTIIGVEDHKVIAKISKMFLKCTESKIKIHLAQGIGRGEKMDFIIQKAVELGVNKITPILTAHCNVKLTDNSSKNRLLRWKTIIINACEQSGRTYVPEIEQPQQFSKLLTGTSNALKIVFDPQATTKINDVDFHKSETMILIGPEGGFSEEELMQTKQHGFFHVKLGPRILRTETAALAAISALQTIAGDF